MLGVCDQSETPRDHGYASWKTEAAAWSKNCFSHSFKMANMTSRNQFLTMLFICFNRVFLSRIPTLLRIIMSHLLVWFNCSSRNVEGVRNRLRQENQRFLLVSFVCGGKLKHTLV